MLNKRYISAITKRLEADVAEAEAGLLLYLSTSSLTAIGEHSDLLEEQLKFIGKLTDAHDRLERFEKFLEEVRVEELVEN